MLFFDVTVGELVAASTWNPVEVLNSEPTIGLDIETSCPNNDWKTGGWHNGRIEVIQVYMPSVRTVVILDMQSITTEGRLFLEALRWAFHRGIEVIAHNAVFEYLWVRKHLKVAIKEIRCTMVGNQMLDAGLHFALSAVYGQKPNKLSTVCLRRLGIEGVDKTEQSADWSVRPLTASQLKYAALDAYLCYTCWIAMLPRLKQQGVAFEAEMLAIKAFGELQANGMPGDKEYLERYLAEYQAVEDKLKAELEGIFLEEFERCPELMGIFPKKYQQDIAKAKENYAKLQATATADPPFEIDYKSRRNDKKVAQVLGISYSPILGDEYYEVALREALLIPKNREVLLTKKAQATYQKWLDCRVAARAPLQNFTIIVNINSPGQIKGFLEHLLGVPLESTESEDLLPHADHPFVEKLLEYRHISKRRDYLSQYLRAYREGAVYGSYSSLSVKGNGRSDSSKPNLQNVPKPSATIKKYGLSPVREVFRLLPEQTEKISFGLLDAAGSHLQIARHLSRDALLKKALDDKIKVHFLTSQAILDIRGTALTVQEIIKAFKDEQHEHHSLIKGHVYPQSKTVIYAFLNLSGALTLQATFRGYGDTVELATCQDLIKACRTGYSELWAYIQKNLEKAQHTTYGIYDQSKYYQAERKVFEACGLTISPRVNHSSWLGQFTVVELPDGRCNFVPMKSKKSSKGIERYIDGAAVVSYYWLSSEATALKLMMGTLVRWGQEHTQYGFRLRGFAHDEVIFSCNTEYKDVVGDKVHATMTESFRRVCADFEPEKPYFDGWIENWNQK